MNPIENISPIRIGMKRLKEIICWIEENHVNDNYPGIREVAKEIRRRFCPHRRFSKPTYIAKSTSAMIVYKDAFAEVFGMPEDTISYCSRWPMTLTVKQWINHRHEFWKEFLGL